MNPPIQSANIRAMTEEERRIGHDLQQDLLWKVGDFITKGMHIHMNIRDRQLYERMKLAFLEYNKWLRR